MFTNLFRSGFLILLLSFSAITIAAPNNYKTLGSPVPTQDPSKIEVIEFFWYGCPHCYSFEPVLTKWLKNKPKNVQFIRQPAIFSKVWGDHAKAYFTADALGVVDKVHADFFNSIQNLKKKPRTDDQLAKFFAEHGIDETEFRDTYNSFLVDTKMRQAKNLPKRYGLTGVPAIIVNGKYLVTAKLAGSQEKMIAVINELIELELSAK